MKFYLGTDDVYWLWGNPLPYSLFISDRRLNRYKKYKLAINPWALDSGGFTELNLFGEWRTSPTQYVGRIKRYQNEIGLLEWASPQDWMCEPFVLEKSGKTVEEHQELTINNFIELQMLAPELPIIPALQGWHPDDYLRHRDSYMSRGVDLAEYDRVGMGTFCRRASLNPVHNLVFRLWNDGIKMHGYGVKSDGLPLFGDQMKSTDSMAWSLTARRAPGNLCGTSHKATKCSHCQNYAVQWANNTVAKIGSRLPQMELELV